MSDIPLPVVDLVESATHELLNGQPNWSAAMQLADILNTQPHQTGALLTALRKRLTHKKHSVGLVAITLLSSLIKNAPKNLLPFLATDEFMYELIHILPKQIRDPHNKNFLSGWFDYTRDIQAMERFDSLLLCIEQLAKTYGQERRYSIFEAEYRKLLRQGVIFPKPELDELAPVQTPQVNPKVREQTLAQNQAAIEAAQRAELERQQQTEEAKRRALQQQAKNYRDADARAAIETALLFTDTLTETSPNEDLTKNELVTMIWDALKPLAKKLHERLPALTTGSDERTLAEVLQANDECMAAANYYEGLRNGTMKRRVRAAPQPQPEPIKSVSTPAAASSLAPAPVARKSSISPKASKSKPKAVPLLTPPPTSAASSATPQRKQRGSAESSPKAAISVQQPTFDLFGAFDQPQQSQPQQQQFAGPSSAASHRSSQSANLYPQLNSQQEGYTAPQQQQAFYSPQYQSQPQQHFESQHRKSASGQQPAKSSFALAPPPQAAGNIDFFQQQQQQQQQQQYQQPPQYQPAAAPYKTPFDELSPDPVGEDPFLALATRSGEKSPQAAISAAQPSFAAPAAAATNQQKAKQKPKKSVVEEFDLLSM